MTIDRSRAPLRALALATLFFAPWAHAQLTDQTQTPNLEHAGILKSLPEEIGAGVGDLVTPDSSTIIIIARDPAR